MIDIVTLVIMMISEHDKSLAVNIQLSNTFPKDVQCFWKDRFILYIFNQVICSLVSIWVLERFWAIRKMFLLKTGELETGYTPIGAPRWQRPPGGGADLLQHLLVPPSPGGGGQVRGPHPCCGGIPVGPRGWLVTYKYEGTAITKY